MFFAHLILYYKLIIIRVESHESLYEIKERPTLYVARCIIIISYMHEYRQTSNLNKISRLIIPLGVVKAGDTPTQPTTAVISHLTTLSTLNK